MAEQHKSQASGQGLGPGSDSSRNTLNLGKKPRLSITVIALNEERDLPRCLASLSFADEVIVVDSGSTDRTVDVAKSHGAKVVVEAWRGYGAQKNFAMQQTRGDWIFNVDADEVVTPELRDEILSEIRSDLPASGYFVARKTFYMGRWIRFGGWYPNYVTRLVRREQGQWSEPNVHEALIINGEVRYLKNPMLHFTFSDIADQVRTNMRYARQGALDLQTKGRQASILKLLVKPLGKFFETYFFKMGCFDGIAGFIISINAAHSMFLKYAYLLEMQLANSEQRKP